MLSFTRPLWLDDPACSVDSRALALLEGAAEALAGAGARVSRSRPPLDLADMASLFTSLITPAISLSVDKETGEAISGTVRTWLENHRRRTEVRRIWADWFKDFDVLLCPVLPMLPFEHDQHGTIYDRFVDINGTPRNHIDALSWTGLIGVAYLPSTVVPVGRVPVGDIELPVGIQVVGPYLEDRTSIFVAGRLAEITGGYVPPPMAR